MSMRDYVNNLKDEQGYPLITIEGYYDRFIAQPRGYAWTFGKGGLKGKVLCPFKDHDDKVPSFGVMYGRGGVQLYHCFGCGKTGDVSSLHRHIMQDAGKSIKNDEKAAEDLLKLYGRKVPSVFEVSGNVAAGSMSEMFEHISREDSYTEADYMRDINRARQRGVSDLASYISLCNARLASAMPVVQKRGTEGRDYGDSEEL